MSSLSNGKLGELLGVSFATASRIRSGARLPSIEVMYRVKQLWGWSMDDQTEARLGGNYHLQFSDLIKGNPANVGAASSPSA